MKGIKEPTNWDNYQCILNLSKRFFKQEKTTKLLLVISSVNLLLNLLLNLIQMLLKQ